MPATLRPHASRLAATSLPDLIAADPARATEFALRVGPLYANFARQRYDREALDALFTLVGRHGLTAALKRLADGETVNPTEHRAALHTALRGDVSTTPAAQGAAAQARQMRVRMATLIEELTASNITDIISIGIGGSDLGPRLVVDALATPDARFRVHFVSNVDGEAIQRVLAQLHPERTAAVLISKTFTTQETLLNGQVVREWLGGDHRLYAVSAHLERAAAFGIAQGRTLPMWEWVGGRYSLWSAVGFPIALGIGMDAFDALLAGAHQFDRHALTAPPRRNLAIWHALTALWNRNGLNLPTQAVLPYCERLKLLPNYLQQLVMESLGKSARVDGAPLTGDTVPVWWGGPGTDTQHSFFQALHQGTQIVPGDFIGVIAAGHPHRDNHRALLANLLAQTEALANGQSNPDPHRAYPGNRPSTLDALTPEALGTLIALYEHSVYLQSVVLGINAFDQFGVELGKHLAGQLLPVLQGNACADDPITDVITNVIKSTHN